MPTADELQAFLTQRGVEFEQTPIQHGTKFTVRSGEVICHYFKRDTTVVQGRSDTELAQAIKAWADSGVSPTVASQGSGSGGAPAAGPNRDVFIVYGHDEVDRNALELMLRRMGLNPIVLMNLTPSGDTIIEKLEQYLGEHSNVGFACVLLTPDDEGHAKGRSEDKRYRARQNVVLELGMVLARLGRKRVAILHKQSIELPSDISGLIYMGYEEQVSEVGNHLFRQLQDVGYTPDSSGLS